MDNLTQSLKELQAALEAADEPILKDKPLTVEDEMGRAQKYLTDKTSKALSKVSKSLLVTEQRFLGRQKVYKCVYYGVRVAESQIELGVQKISETLNKLAERGLIHSALAPFISVKLIRCAFEVPVVAVCSYVLVPASLEHEAKQMEYSIDECAYNMKTLGDVRAPLKDGEVGALVRVSACLSLIDSNKAKLEDLLQQQIDAYLKVLPEGTVHVSTEPLAIMDLSVPYEVKFYNPLLQYFSKVELEYARSCAVIDEKVEEFNLITGIRYWNKEGEEVYR